MLQSCSPIWTPKKWNKQMHMCGIRAPPKLEISLNLPDFPKTLLSGNLSGLKKSLGIGDGFPNTSRVLVEYGHSPHHQSYP